MPAELAAQLLADLHGDPALARPRRLARGAVLADGHLDLCDLDVATTAAVLADLAPTRPRGLWLAALDPPAALSTVLAAHPQLEHLALAAPLPPAALAALAPALAGLRSLALTLPPGVDLSVLLDMLPRTGPAHLHLGGPLDDRAADALAAALRRGAPWRTLRVPTVAPTAALLAAAERSDLARLDVAAPLPPALLARLCHNANRARVAPPPDLARLRLRLPAILEPAPPLPDGLDPADLDACRRVLAAMSLRTGRLRADHPQLADLRGAILRLTRAERRAIARPPRPDRAEQRALDRLRDSSSQLRRRRGAVQGPAPGPDEPAPPELDDSLAQPRACYVCKRLYRRRHFFYDRLCPPCGDASHARRDDRLDLRGRLALVTGGRVKIGHAVALRLLRWGARVIVTTRFPRDAARRFADEPDFAAFADRLQIYPLDLRGVPDVERFAAHLAATEPRLDILINNAAQTVWRPPSYYAPLLAEESGPALPEPLRRLLPAAPDLARRDLPAALDLAPAAGVDGFGQPLDLRASNSWRQRLHEVDAIEMVEVQLINTVAPALLTARLRPLLARPRTSPRDASFVVQVSAPEGRFYRHYKSPYHPHTNMAKAALNMLTRTSAEDYAADAIYMNSVDTGWISNENPRPIADAMDARGFAPPLDLVDAAARVCDPIVRGLRDGERMWGLFLKDFRAISW